MRFFFISSCFRFAFIKVFPFSHPFTALLVFSIVLCLHFFRISSSVLANGRLRTCYKCFSIVFLHWWIIITWNVSHFYCFLCVCVSYAQNKISKIMARINIVMLEFVYWRAKRDDEEVGKKYHIRPPPIFIFIYITIYFK